MKYMYDITNSCDYRISMEGAAPYVKKYAEQIAVLDAAADEKGNIVINGFGRRMLRYPALVDDMMTRSFISMEVAVYCIYRKKAPHVVFSVPTGRMFKIAQSEYEDGLVQL